MFPKWEPQPLPNAIKRYKAYDLFLVKIENYVRRESFTFCFFFYVETYDLRSFQKDIGKKCNGTFVF